MAVVHSTVWIFAMRAATTRRALSKIWSSGHDGYAACSMSQTALCSRMNTVCSSSSPIHQPSCPPELPSSDGSTLGGSLLLDTHGRRKIVEWASRSNGC
jgi:hypothetical protein